MTGDPIALYVVFSDTVWLILIGKSALSEYNENRTPVSLLVIFSNALPGIMITFIGDALAVLVSGSLYPVSFPLEELAADSGSVIVKQVPKGENTG